MNQDERGYIVVETIGCFTLFVFLVISILSLINIVAVQARVHYAITQAAETVSMYSYTLDAMGLAGHMVNSATRANKTGEELNTFKSNVNEVIEAIETLSISGIKASGDAMAQQGSSVAKDIRDNPRDVLQNLMNFGIQKAGSAAYGQLLKPLLNRYLRNGDMSGDEYLKAFHVVDGINGLKFTTFDIIGWDSTANRFKTTQPEDSQILTKDGDVRIVVTYKIDYTFGALPLPFRDKDGNSYLTVTQEVVTKAWLKGVGEGYTAP